MGLPRIEFQFQTWLGGQGVCAQGQGLKIPLTLALSHSLSGVFFINAIKNYQKICGLKEQKL